MTIKRGVRLQGLRPELIPAMMVAQSVYAANGCGFEITSVVEGAHMRGSLHYSGAAFDCGIAGISALNAKQLSELIRSSLPGDFDVVLELERVHIHVEYQPKEQVTR